MNHEIFAARVEQIAMATGIIAGVSAAAATFATPDGLDAIGVWLGLVEEPAVVTLAPMLGTLATASGTISGFTYFYAKWRMRQTKKQSVSNRSAPGD